MNTSFFCKWFSTFHSPKRYFFEWFVCERHGVHEAWEWDTFIYLFITNHGMQPWMHYLLAIIFYNNSMDATGAAKPAALYILANTDVQLTSPPRRVDPQWGSSLGAIQTGENDLFFLHLPRHRFKNICIHINDQKRCSSDSRPLGGAWHHQKRRRRDGACALSLRVVNRQ